VAIRYLQTVIEKLRVRCDCGHEFSASNLVKHREEECALRLLECPLTCGWQGPFEALQAHVPNECALMLVRCPGDKCGMIIRRGDLLKHQAVCRPVPVRVEEPPAAATEGRISPDAWKRRLRVGDKIDAMDKTKNWFEAVVVEVHPQSIKVHFKGWDSKWDEVIPLESERIERLHSKTFPWRESLQEGMMVEVKFENLKWGSGRITQREGDMIKVCDVNDSSKLLGIFPLDSDMICRPGTHVKMRGAGSQTVQLEQARPHTPRPSPPCHMRTSSWMSKSQPPCSEESSRGFAETFPRLPSLVCRRPVRPWLPCRPSHQRRRAWWR
jgi:hypothetical protein